MAIRQSLIDTFEWKRLLGFENTREAWFKGVDSRAKFCLFVAKKSGRTESIEVAFGVRTAHQLQSIVAGGAMRMPVAMIREFSPDALTIMELASQRDVTIASKMYSAWPKFGDESAGHPRRHYLREIDMGSDRDLFSEDLSDLPLFEGRMVAAFDYRAKAYVTGRGRSAVWEDLPFCHPQKRVRPQWYVPRARLPRKLGERPFRYRIGWCDVGSPTNERTMVAALIPMHAVCGHSVPTLEFVPQEYWRYMVWLAVANSFAMDYLVRMKATLHISMTLVDSLPFPRLSRSDARTAEIVDTACRLTCTGPETRGYWDMLARDGWVEELGDGDPMPGIGDAELRTAARAKLDAIIARDLFGLTRDELIYVLESFPIVRDRDMVASGHFRTRDMILEHFDIA